ncbi:MAG: VTT domain-containing protein [Patescibacteria group bacterium]|nr:VTT domain-containing protein [Patescibacteria group bacterium]MDE2015288.1 VTT domain-containing protein [Patescibacteria group bacterium]MDE2227094.1 VTT domain-containing protein [Patescibacteria group bacterium]
MNPVFAETVAWTISHGYVVMFLLMLIEGPVVTAAGAFVAALGGNYFNIWIVLLLSILGNLLPDIAYYAIGFWGRQELINKYGHYFHITKERVERLEKLYLEHVGKTLTLVKLVPVLATPGLIIAGVSKVPLKKYVWWSLAITLPTSGFYLILGYYFGAAYEKVIRYLNYGSYFTIAIIIIFVIISYLHKKYGSKLAERIDSGNQD